MVVAEVRRVWASGADSGVISVDNSIGAGRDRCFSGQRECCRRGAFASR